MLKKFGKSAFVQNAMGYLFYLYSILVCHTNRWTVTNWPRSLENDGKSFLLMFWHGRLFSGPPIYFKARPKLKTYLLTSGHRDGLVLASTVKRYNTESILGSSSKGGVKAALAIFRALKQGSIVSLAPDGRKPGYKMTKGSVVLAKDAQSPIVLCAFSTSRARRLKTWDRCLVPYPFGKGILLFSDPIYVPKDLDEPQIELWRERLEKMLTNLTLDADELVGLAPDPLLEKKDV